MVVKTQDGGELRTQVKIIQQGQLEGTYDAVLLCCKAYDLGGAMMPSVRPWASRA